MRITGAVNPLGPVPTEFPRASTSSVWPRLFWVNLASSLPPLVQCGTMHSCMFKCFNAPAFCFVPTGRGSEPWAYLLGKRAQVFISFSIHENFIRNAADHNGVFILSC